jgi:hypothetical protein
MIALLPKPRESGVQRRGEARSFSRAARRARAHLTLRYQGCATALVGCSGITAIRRRPADTEVASLAVNPCDVCLIETDAKTAKRLRDREISRLQSQSCFQKRTCLVRETLNQESKR